MDLYRQRGDNSSTTSTACVGGLPEATYVTDDWISILFDEQEKTTSTSKSTIKVTNDRTIHRGICCR